MKKPYTAPRCTLLRVEQRLMLTQSLTQSRFIIEDSDDPAMDAFILWGGVSTYDTHPTDDQGKRWGD